MISKYLLIVFLLIGSNTFAQKAIITGKILDDQTGIALSGDSIVLIEKSITTKTDQNGIFTFSKLPAGNYSLKCRRKGYVEKIVDIIKKKKYNICILAPSGKDKQPLPWKSGYYYIAKSLGWDLRVVGFDFEKKRLKVGNIISSSYEMEIAQAFLQKEMEDIVPLRPQNSWTPVRHYDKKKLSFIQIDGILILFIISLISWIIIMKIHKIGFVDILISAYGFLLQLHPNIIIKIIGFSIVYQHIFVKYMKYPRAPEAVIILGALSGALIGIKNKNVYVYMPLIYSFLSKVPVYVTDTTGQIRVIIMSIILSIVVGEYTSKQPVRFAKKDYN
jgi:hypothetical protein